MPKRKAASESFMDMVMRGRDADRVRYGDTLAEVQGPPPHSEHVSEDELDQQWMWKDPASPPLARLLAPKEEGGMGLTPFQASMVQYPWRGPQLEAAGGGVDTPEAVAYSNRRHERIMAKQAEAASPVAPPPAPAPPPFSTAPAPPGTPQEGSPWNPGSPPNPPVGGGLSPTTDSALLGSSDGAPSAWPPSSPTPPGGGSSPPTA